MKRSIKQLLSCLLVGIMMLIGCHPATQATPSTTVSSSRSAEETFEAFYRIGRDNAKAWQKELARVRIITKGHYTFGKPKAQYEMDSDFIPTKKGLNSLNISGSAQFSQKQFHKLMQQLKEAAPGKEIYVLDLRMESHALLNGIEVSWYGYHNWANKGLTDDEIDTDETTRFGQLVGKTITAYSKMDEAKAHGMKLQVTDVMSEQQLVEKEGAHYVRIHCADYSWPQPEQIDQFITFINSIDTKKSWLHFHCHAGLGRTGIFMSLYDKMKNPELSLEDILTRQALLGAKYLLYVEPEDDFQHDLSLEITRMLPLLFAYVEEMAATHYQTSWQDYLTAHTS